jgi:ankyrin repeat protein
MVFRRTYSFFSTTVLGLVIAAFVLGACTRDSSQDFVTAAKTGDLETVIRLLKDGVDVDATDSKHRATALMWAAHEGHPEIVKVLIEKGAAIDARNPTGETALWFSAQKGKIEALKILHENGADSNVIGERGETALDVARKNGHQDIVDYLRQAGVAE